MENRLESMRKLIEEDWRGDEETRQYLRQLYEDLVDRYQRISCALSL